VRQRLELRVARTGVCISRHAEIGPARNHVAAQNLIATKRQEDRIIDGLDQRVCLRDSLTLVAVTDGARSRKDRGSRDPRVRAAVVSVLRWFAVGRHARWRVAGRSPLRRDPGSVVYYLEQHRALFA